MWFEADLTPARANTYYLHMFDETFERVFCEQWFPRIDDRSFSATVVGAGIIGLSTALAIKSSFPGAAVTIVAEQTEGLTSDVAAGFWFPYQQKDGRAASLARETFDMLVQLMDAFPPDAEKNLTQALRNGQPTNLPVMWIDALSLRKNPSHEFRDIPAAGRRASAEELPNSKAKAGLFWTSVMMQSPLYLGILRRLTIKRGIQLEQRRIDSKGELNANVLVNCAGIGGIALGDPELRPLQGTVVLVENGFARNTPFDGLMLESVEPDAGEEIAVIIPRHDGTILGGTARPINSLHTPVSDIGGIIDRCEALLPGVNRATFKQVMVGVRPARDTFLLGQDANDSRWLNSNGYGGGGWTVHLGAAHCIVKSVDDMTKKG